MTNDGEDHELVKEDKGAMSQDSMWLPYARAVFNKGKVPEIKQNYGKEYQDDEEEDEEENEDEDESDVETGFVYTREKEGWNSRESWSTFPGFSWPLASFLDDDQYNRTRFRFSKETRKCHIDIRD